MLKKLITAAGAGCLVLAMFFGRDVSSYVGTAFGWMNDSVRDQVPIQFELDRARQMIADLTPEVRSNLHQIAREEIEVERLREQIERLEARQAKGEASLKRIQGELASGREEIRFGTTRYTAAEAENLAKTRLQRYKTDDLTLDNLRRVLAARERGLDAARKKLDAMMVAKQQLLAEVANLEARRKMNEVARTTSEFHVDQSHLARTRELVRDIEKRISVEEKLVDVEYNYLTDEMLLEEDTDSSSDIVDEIASYFNSQPAATTLAEAAVDEAF